MKKWLPSYMHMHVRAHTHAPRAQQVGDGLSRRYKVSKVQVWNRIDCCSSRLAGWTVTVDGAACGRLSGSRQQVLYLYVYTESGVQAHTRNMNVCMHICVEVCACSRVNYR